MKKRSGADSGILETIRDYGVRIAASIGGFALYGCMAALAASGRTAAAAIMSAAAIALTFRHLSGGKEAALDGRKTMADGTGTGGDACSEGGFETMDDTRTMEERIREDTTTCGRLCGHRSVPEYRGGYVSVPRAGRTYRMATVPYDRTKGGFDEGGRDERLIEIVSIDGIADTCLGDELSFTGRDLDTGEKMRGSMMIGNRTDGSGSRAVYGIRAIAEMSCVSDPEADCPGNAAYGLPEVRYGEDPMAECADIMPDALPDVYPMPEGRKYDLTVVLPDGNRRVLHGASRHMPDRRCSSVDGSGCRLEYRIDLSPEDKGILGGGAGVLHCSAEMDRLDGSGIRMTLGRDVLDDREFEVARVAPADGDAARDAAESLNRQLRTFARLRGVMLALSAGPAVDR